MRAAITEPTGRQFRDDVVTPHSWFIIIATACTRCRPVPFEGHRVKLSSRIATPW